jgi:hypothetical protein
VTGFVDASPAAGSSSENPLALVTRTVKAPSCWRASISARPGPSSMRSMRVQYAF